MDKKSFKDKLKDTFNRKRLANFLDKQGFYIVLLLCLCIIGVTAFLTSDGFGLRNNPEEPDVPADDIEFSPEDPIDITITDIYGEDDDDSEPAGSGNSGGSEQPGDEGKTADAGQQSSDPDDEGGTEAGGDDSDMPDEAGNISEDLPVSVNTQVKDAPETMQMPVEGEIIKEFAMDRLVYSRTLKEWTTHEGLDIKGDQGAEVRAALGGTIESIDEDALRGITITIDHDNGLKTVYTGLSTKDMVKPGQEVEKGQVISGIGRTAAFEISDAPHVHFEVILDGEHQDPMLYLDEQTE